LQQGEHVKGEITAARTARGKKQDLAAVRFEAWRRPKEKDS